MEPTETEKPFWSPTNSHDRFCRRTAFNPFYATDFLRCYGDPVLAKYVDLDNLREAPTTYLSDELKEVIMDASLATRLVDGKNASEVLLHLEHKSKPEPHVAIQLLTEAALSLHFRRFSSQKSGESKFVPPIPLMVLIYNGFENWDGDIWFQDSYEDLPIPLQQYVIQFKLLTTNLKHFHYGHLPGERPTQAIVESLKRATDGTFIKHLPNIFEHVARSNLDEQRRLDLSRSISSYATWNDGASPKSIIDAIHASFKRQEAVDMAQIIQNTFIQEGIEIGKIEGRIEGKIEGIVEGMVEGFAKGRAEEKISSKIEAVLTVLQTRFGQVPPDVTEAIRKMNDSTALESHLGVASICASVEEFANSLK